MMTMKSIRTVFLFAAAAFSVSAASATDEIIAKARQHLGGDEALNAIRSIYYEGEFESEDGAKGTVKIYFQKPMQQRVELTRDELGEISALNDIDGWRKVYDVNDPSRWQVTLLDAPKIRELQANTWENLNFFRGIERRRGRIEDKGTVELDDTQARKLVFHHPSRVYFTRYFDTDTGRLIMTETTDGTRIREHGENRVNGVVFPDRIVMTQADGTLVNEIRFHKVTVNEEFEDSLFDVPPFAP